MDDKFIMMGLDDERSKKVAEVLGNKTCKKIIDYLSENKEASEKDIADALQIPINTTEYNLKKLLETGLVEKTKNFFWSKKGRKIDLYKIAKKHIVISPRSKPTLTALKTIIPIIVVVLVINIILFSYILPEPDVYQNQTGSDISDNILKESKFKTFNSLDEIKEYIKDNTKTSGGIFERFGGNVAMEAATAGASADKSSGAGEYSTTNIQVEGVDEADIVKNDDKYIYAVSGNKVVIVNAYPAEDMKVLSEINFSDYISNIFINDDKLIVFSSGQVQTGEERCYDDYYDGKGVVERCYPITEPVTSVYIYDVSDREEPELEDKISVSGNYINSRMIKDYVYVISNKYINDYVGLPIVYENGDEKQIQPTEIAYDPDIKDQSFQYVIISAINVKTGESNQETVLSGYTSQIYVSQENIYLTNYKYSGWYEKTIAGEPSESTIIKKVSIDKDKINFVASGEVPGHIDNQFSMDEYDNTFRITTTINQNWGVEASQSQNNLYVLDEDMNTIGKLEGLAPGESIYSTRFIGERAYVVTFKKVDPLFVIDLSDSENPKVLGKLKIPGYSDYLHPYDENHIIGIGKDAEESDKGDFALYQGVKLAIFDVSDVENPIEMHKVIIGDRGTNSEALNDHKAFLFDREKQLLVIPIEVYEIAEKTQDSWRYGEYTFQGAYVYNINLENGFELIDKITHVTEDEELKRGGYYNYATQIRRSLYMDNILYTISSVLIKANNLDNNLDEINSVKLPYEEQRYYYGGEVGIAVAG